MSEQEELWKKLTEFRQIHADGMFFCKNDKGSKILLLYHEGEKIFITCDIGECDHGLDFEQRH